MNKKIIFGICMLLLLVSIVYAEDKFHEEINKVREDNIKKFFDLAESAEKIPALNVESSEFEKTKKEAIKTLEVAKDIYEMCDNEFYRMGLIDESDKCKEKHQEMLITIQEIEDLEGPEEVEELEQAIEDAINGAEPAKKKSLFRKYWWVAIILLMIVFRKKIEKKVKDKYDGYKNKKFSRHTWRLDLYIQLRNAIQRGINNLNNPAFTSTERITILDEVLKARRLLAKLYPRDIISRDVKLERLLKALNDELESRNEPRIENDHNT